MTNQEAEELSYALETINVADTALNQYQGFAKLVVETLDCQGKPTKMTAKIKELQDFIDEHLNPSLTAYYTNKNVLLKKYGTKPGTDPAPEDNKPPSEKAEAFLNNLKI